MPLTLPSASTANTESTADAAAIVSAANDAFKQAITALILASIPLGLFSVAPPLPLNTDYNVINTYFTGLGYTVNINLTPTTDYLSSLPSSDFGVFQQFQPANPPPGYPSSGWADWQIYVSRVHPAVTVSWSS